MPGESFQPRNRVSLQPSIYVIKPSNHQTTVRRWKIKEDEEIQSTKLWDLSDSNQQAFCIHLNSAIWNLLEKFTYWPLVYSSCIPFCMCVCRAPDNTTTAELCPFLSITSRIGSSTSVRSTKDQPPIQHTFLCHEGWPGSPCTSEKGETFSIFAPLEILAERAVSVQ